MSPMQKHNELHDDDFYETDIELASNKTPIEFDKIIMSPGSDSTMVNRISITSKTKEKSSEIRGKSSKNIFQSP